METQISPEPSAEERAAIEAALEDAAADPPQPSPWWREGVREAVVKDGDEA